MEKATRLVGDEIREATTKKGRAHEYATRSRRDIAYNIAPLTLYHIHFPTHTLRHGKMELWDPNHFFRRKVITPLPQRGSANNMDKNTFF